MTTAERASASQSTSERLAMRDTAAKSNIPTQQELDAEKLGTILSHLRTTKQLGVKLDRLIANQIELLEEPYGDALLPFLTELRDVISNDYRQLCPRYMGQHVAELQELVGKVSRDQLAEIVLEFL